MQSRKANKQQKTILFPGTENSPKQMVLSDVKLGEGCYGTVFAGYAKDDPSKIYAVKCIDRTKIKGEKAMQALKNEVAIMAGINS